MSLQDWHDIIDRTALGFDQLKPPGLAEVTALSPDGSPIAAADASANRSRPVEVGCGQGPVLAVSGRFVQTAVATTVDALQSGRPIPARPCDTAPIALRPGVQELLISPGPAFIADGVELDGPLADRLTTAQTSPAGIASWSSDRREITVTRSPSTRVLVVPESVNPGWVAHTPGGATLTAVTVNGWQQGWVVPAGERGPVTLSFPSNRAYRAWLTGGLALMPILLLLALVPVRRPSAPQTARRPWSSRTAAAIGVVGATTLIAGPAGAAASIITLIARRLLGHREELRDRLTLAVVPGGLILAGALLSRYPWRSVDGYIGPSPWVQLPALLAVAALAASVLPVPNTHRKRVRPSAESDITTEGGS